MPARVLGHQACRGDERTPPGSLTVADSRACVRPSGRSDRGDPDPLTTPSTTRRPPPLGAAGPARHRFGIRAGASADSAPCSGRGDANTATPARRPRRFATEALPGSRVPHRTTRPRSTARRRIPRATVRALLGDTPTSTDHREARPRRRAPLARRTRRRRTATCSGTHEQRRPLSSPGDPSTGPHLGRTACREPTRRAAAHVVVPRETTRGRLCTACRRPDEDRVGAPQPAGAVPLSPAGVHSVRAASRRPTNPLLLCTAPLARREGSIPRRCTAPPHAPTRAHLPRARHPPSPYLRTRPPARSPAGR